MPLTATTRFRCYGFALACLSVACMPAPPPARYPIFKALRWLLDVAGISPELVASQGMWYRRCQRSKVQGFTLAETAVVGAASLLLAFVSLPMLQGKQDRMLAARCMANQRQLGMAVLSYAADHDNRLPPRWGGYTGPYARWSWAHFLERKGYISTHAFQNGFLCPVRGQRRRDPSWPDMLYSYGINDDYLMHNGGYPYTGTNPKKVTEIEEPVRTPLLMDANSYKTGKSFAQRSIGSFWPHYRHEDQITVVWLDGHVSAISSNELWQCPYW